MVPHWAIGKSLESKGAGPNTIANIQRMYENISTNIKFGNTMVHIRLQRGVKQWDPMSPLLFNIILDPILARKEQQGLGMKQAGEEISVLAFADDVILVSETPEGAQRQLNVRDGDLAKQGMGLDAGKCTVNHNMVYIHRPCHF
jgi:Reverse transcriptase (RNA-dependent DNA polymerase)